MYWLLNRPRLRSEMSMRLAFRCCPSIRPAAMAALMRPTCTPRIAAAARQEIEASGRPDGARLLRRDSNWDCSIRASRNAGPLPLRRARIRKRPSNSAATTSDHAIGSSSPCIPSRSGSERAVRLHSGASRSLLVSSWREPLSKSSSPPASRLASSSVTPARKPASARAPTQCVGTASSRPHCSAVREFRQMPTALSTASRR